MLVLAQVSSMKTSPRRIKPVLIRLPPRPAPRHIRTKLLGCEQGFFEAQRRVVHEPPDRAVARHHAALAEFHHQRSQGHVRRRLEPSQDPGPLRRQRTLLPTSHRLRRCTPRRAEPLRPLHNAGHSHLERSSDLPAAQTRGHRRHYALAKIKRIGSRHPPFGGGRPLVSAVVA
jgi:hypothetical protein